MSRFILTALMILTTLPAAMPVVAGVFGDGDPDNGPEDDRRSISVGGYPPPTADWYRGSGTLVCDGEVRGSATLLDVTALAPDLAGVVLATAAHVLYDLQQGTPWNECRFAFMGLAELPGYTAPLTRSHQLLGGFRPAAMPSDPEQGGGDWAFFWLGPDWEPPPPWFGFPPGRLPGGAPADTRRGSLGLVAWDQTKGEVSVTSGCQGVHSVTTDIGGGAWSGQLLDDCDSGLGASGGGVIIHDGARSHLFAIRGGSHWDPDLWPPAQFPHGPPPGTPWNPNSFTNYARALDESILITLARWLSLLPRT